LGLLAFEGSLFDNSYSRECMYEIWVGQGFLSFSLSVLPLVLINVGSSVLFCKTRSVYSSEPLYSYCVQLILQTFLNIY
jgi:hypothetical protein